MLFQLAGLLENKKLMIIGKKETDLPLGNSMSRSQINGKMKECIILFNNKLLSAAKLWLSEKVFYPPEVCFY